jgi:hypothetical protein
MSEPPNPQDPDVRRSAPCSPGCGAQTTSAGSSRPSGGLRPRASRPDLAVLQVGLAALNLAGVDRDSPIAEAELVSTHLPEINFRNQRALQERTTYALNAVAAIRGGLEPDVLEDTYWWGTRDIVQYAVIAATAYVRACARRRGQTLQQFVDDLGRSMSRQEE